MRATQATWQVATRATAINGGRGRSTTALLVPALALSSLATAGSKAVHGHDHMITHQGIIMALHGIIDHLDLVEMQDDRKLAATALEAHLKTAAAQGVWQVGAPVSRTVLPDPVLVEGLPPGIATVVAGSPPPTAGSSKPRMSRAILMAIFEKLDRNGDRVVDEQGENKIEPSAFCTL